MTGHDGSIYRTCRETAGMTREQAAERLNCSVRALARYEAGEQRTPDDVAYRMAVLYDSQYLAVQHLRLVSQLAADLLPTVAMRDLSVATISQTRPHDKREVKSMRIKELREAAGMSQRELGERIGISGPAVAMWESGENRPSLTNLEKLADVLGVSIDAILGREPA